MILFSYITGNSSLEPLLEGLLAKCTVRVIHKSSQICIQAHDIMIMLEVLPHINLYLSTRQPQNIWVSRSRWDRIFFVKNALDVFDGPGEHSFQIKGWMRWSMTQRT